MPLCLLLEGKRESADLDMSGVKSGHPERSSGLGGGAP